MGTEENETEKEKCKKRGVRISHGTNAIYGIGVIGALAYFIKTATSFWVGVWGVIKAVFWPAVVVYKVLELLKL